MIKNFSDLFERLNESDYIELVDVMSSYLKYLDLDFSSDEVARARAYGKIYGIVTTLSFCRVISIEEYELLICKLNNY